MSSLGSNPFRDFAAAVGFLTVLPLGRGSSPQEPTDAVGFYPAVGWLLGGTGVGVAALITAASGSPKPLVSGPMILLVWGVLTGGLHWDGLADAADGLFGATEPKRRLEIMRDSSTGAFGATAIAVVALVASGSIGTLAGEGVVWPLLAAPVLARFCAAVAAWSLPSARDDGLGFSVMRRPSVFAMLTAIALVLPVAWIAWLELVASAGESAGVTALGLLGAALLFGTWFPRALAKRVGGMTGDLFGATVVCVETFILACGAIAA